MLIFFGNLPTILPLFPKSDRLKAFVFVFLIYSILMITLAATATFFIVKYDRYEVETSNDNKNIDTDHKESTSTIKKIRKPRKSENASFSKNKLQKNKEDSTPNLKKQDINKDSSNEKQKNSKYKERNEISSKITPYSKAIIVNGSALKMNGLFDSMQVCSNLAYQILLRNGFYKSNIYYLNAVEIDSDGNGILDDIDGEPSILNFKFAITEWVGKTNDLIIYMIGHGGKEKFLINLVELITANSRSASFIPTLSSSIVKNRIIVTSASHNEKSRFLFNGSGSFSYIFWTYLFQDNNLKTAFNIAKSQIDKFQTSHLDANGNGISNEKQDFYFVRNIFLEQLSNK